MKPVKVVTPNANTLRIAYYNNQRSAATLSKDAHSRQSSINRPPGYQVSSANSVQDKEKRDSLGSFEFLPSVNFDDFHASLTMDEANPSLFPIPNYMRDMANDTPNFKDEHDSRNGTKIPLKAAGPADSGSGIGRSGSFLRRTNSQTKPIATRAGRESMVQSTEISGVRPRRKSQFPAPDAKINILRSPRKSVGPGILAQDVAGSLGRKLEPSPSIGDDLAASSSRKPSKMFMTARIPGEGLSSDSATRQSKTKSLHIPSGSNHDPFTSPFGTPENTLSSIGSARSPGRAVGQQTGTPSSGKRMSIMPNSAHATGLAARTISPTDARRLKRMSVMPNPPPMPHTPTAPQPEPPFIPQFAIDRTVPSPSLVPRKTSTPTSTRTTPEPNRKSYSSGISNSSTTSYNSCQSGNGPVRISQSFSTSRLPTLKTRNDPAPAGTEEIVPPVPAIPKAYESPKTELDQPFFSTRKGSLLHDASSLTSASTADGVPTPSTDTDAPTILRKSSLKKPTSNDSGSINDRKPSALNNNRKTLQPLRLPPLNLLPLSTPTAAKINALYDGAASTDNGTNTPPPKIGPKGIPSTPMTASRASFFARSQPNEDPMPITAQLRSSSSHYALRSEASSHNGADSSTSTITAGQERSRRRAISPYISSSLPKTSGDFGYLRRTAGNTMDTDPRVDSQCTRLTGPRMQRNHRTPRDDSSSIDNSPVETSTSSFGSSLRRKLSLTRKHSGSKTQSRAGSEDEIPPKPPKHDNMPPPRLPASATWNGPLMPSPSPTQKHNFLPTRRKPSNPISQPIDRNRSHTWTTDGSPQKISVSSDNAASKRTLRSTLEGGHTSSAMSLKDFLKEANAIEMQLDRDDRQAEEEMKKLASKRKDTENAAKELDALRRRATPKERVSASAATRMAQLNIFERGEIVDYKDIFFCGTDHAKKHVGDLNAETANFGYDDERGDYNIVTGDHLAYRYEVVDILGKGSFGQVARCIDHKTGGLVAIKIIRNKKRFHQQALVEVDILQKLRDWVSVLFLKESRVLLIPSRTLKENTAWSNLPRASISEATCVSLPSYWA